MITQVGGHQVAAGNGKYRGYIVNWDVVKPHAKDVSGLFLISVRSRGPNIFPVGRLMALILRAALSNPAGYTQQKARFLQR